MSLGVSDIERYARENGITRSQLAEMIGYSRQTVSNILNGNKEPSEKFLAAAAILIGVEVPVGMAAKRFVANAAALTEPEKFEETYADGKKILQKIGVTDRFQCGEVALTLANLCRRFQRFTRAIEHAEEARTIFIAEHEPVGSVKALYEAAASEYECRYYHAAAGKFILLESEAAAIGDAEMLAKATVSAALCFAQLGDAAMLADYTNRAAERITAIDVPNRVWFDVTADYLRAETFMAAGSYGFAAQAYANTAMRYEAMQDYVNAYRMRYDLAWSLYKDGRLDEALEEVKRVHECACQSDYCDEKMTARAEILISKICSRRGDYDSALEYLIAYLESPELHAPETLARAYRAAAYAYLGKGEKDAFIDYMERAIAVLQDETNEDEMRLAAKIMREYLPHRNR